MHGNGPWNTRTLSERQLQPGDEARVGRPLGACWTECKPETGAGCEPQRDATNTCRTLNCVDRIWPAYQTVEVSELACAGLAWVGAGCQLCVQVVQVIIPGKAHLACDA